MKKIFALLVALMLLVPTLAAAEMTEAEMKKYKYFIKKWTNAKE